MERHHRRTLKPIPDAPGQRRLPTDPPLVYTVAEVATRLKVSPGTVRNMINEGQLFALRLHARRIVVPKWALDELVARPTAASSLHCPASNA